MKNSNIIAFSGLSVVSRTTARWHGAVCRTSVYQGMEQELAHEGFPRNFFPHPTYPFRQVLEVSAGMITDLKILSVRQLDLQF
jgi:hypothetical protein